MIENYPNKEVFEKDKFTCSYCGWKGYTSFEAFYNVHFNIDHVRPVSKAGKDTLENKVVSCAACNVRKGNQGFDHVDAAAKQVKSQRESTRKWYDSHVLEYFRESVDFKRIKECTFAVNQIPENLMDLRDQHPDEPAKYAHVIYLDENTPQIISVKWMASKPERIGELDTFRTHIREFIPLNYTDIRFFLTLYEWNGINEQILDRSTPLSFQFEIEFGLLDEFLAESYGLLVYDYQLEELYRMYNPNITEAVSFRKGVNRRDAEVLEYAKSMVIGSEFSLFSILQDRIYLNSVVHPNSKGSAILYEYFTPYTIPEK